MDYEYYEYDYLEEGQVIQGSKDKLFGWSDSQGSTYGIKSLGFRSNNPNKEADELGLHKDGRSRRGVPPCLRYVDNSKKRGMKAIPKRLKRLSIRNTNA